MRPGGAQIQFGFGRPGKALIGLMLANVVLYVLQLLLLRANQGWVRELYLQPSDVFEQGKVWQIVTYWWFHSEDAVSHLLFNMLMLFWFGAPMERFWGVRRFLLGYGLFALGGSLLTLLVALLSKTSVFSPLLPGFWSTPHLGASGAVVGMTVAWGLSHANQEIRLLLLPPMKGSTFVLIVVFFELLVALSFAGTSSTSHFGGIIASLIVCRGLYRPSSWKTMFRRADLKRKRRKIEAELKLIQGGKSDGDDGPSDPSKWN